MNKHDLALYWFCSMLRFLALAFVVDISTDLRLLRNLSVPGAFLGGLAYAAVASAPLVIVSFIST